MIKCIKNETLLGYLSGNVSEAIVCQGLSSRERAKLKIESLVLLVYNWQLVLRRGCDCSGKDCRVIRARSPRKPTTKDTKKDRKGREQVP